MKIFFTWITWMLQVQSLETQPQIFVFTFIVTRCFGWVKLYSKGQFSSHIFIQKIRKLCLKKVNTFRKKYFDLFNEIKKKTRCAYKWLKIIIKAFNDVLYTCCFIYTKFKHELWKIYDLTSIARSFLLGARIFRIDTIRPLWLNRRTSTVIFRTLSFKIMHWIGFLFFQTARRTAS